jgi:hypothetical protein
VYRLTVRDMTEEYHLVTDTVEIAETLMDARVPLTAAFSGEYPTLFVRYNVDGEPVDVYGCHSVSADLTALVWRLTPAPEWEDVRRA